MSKLITFLISGYIGGAVCLFIHLKFLHLFFKFISSSNVYNDAYTTGYMLGMPITWPLSQFRTTTWVLIMAFIIACWVTFSEKISQIVEEAKEEVEREEKMKKSLELRQKQEAEQAERGQPVKQAKQETEHPR